MLQIKLADRKRARRDDPMGRDWIGYDPTVPDEDLFARNRGVWKLGPRADLESHAMFAYTGDRKIKFVAEIDALERFGDRRAIIGRVLDADHPLSRRWVGRPLHGNYQNPVHYLPDD
jgi:hypothetical protein